MRTLTCNLEAKRKPKFGSKITLPVREWESNVVMATQFGDTDHSWEQYPILLGDWTECDIEGHGTHAQLDTGKEIVITVLMSGHRIRFTGFVTKRFRHKTTIKPNGRIFTMSRKTRNGKWKAVQV